jgi:hypothetical protein
LSKYVKRFLIGCFCCQFFPAKREPIRELYVEPIRELYVEPITELYAEPIRELYVVT